MPSDQEGDDLIADVFIRQPLARRLVHTLKHVGQQVVGLILFLLSLGDDVVDEVVHELAVVLKLAQTLVEERAFKRHAALDHCGLQAAIQRVDERVIVLPVEGVETVVEAADANDVERHGRHVMDDIDFVVGVHPLPFGDKLVGDVQHHRHVVVHRLARECRHQDIVRLAPVRRLRVGGEEAVARNRPHFSQRAAHRLIEAGFVAKLFHDVRAPGHDQRFAHHVELEDRPLFPRDAHQVLQWLRCVDGKKVADNRRFRRRGDRLGIRHATRLPG